MIQDVLDKLKEILVAGMPGKLDEIDTTRSTTTPDIMDFYTEPKDQDSAYRHPAVFMEGVDTVGANQQSMKRKLTHQIVIAVEQENAQEDLLSKELRNHVEAIEKIISADPHLDNTVDQAKVTRHSYSETAREDAGKPWTKVAVLQVEVEERYSP